MAESPYEMNLDLRVLDHLGLRLYSNAAAVLSEAVANAWDADAQVVDITINDSEIVIQDSGVGMSLADINERFLTVGYDKRKRQGETSNAGRSYMGRKGIGKLALFSIADVVQVTTRVAGGPIHGFTMETEKIRETISKGNKYRPTPFEVSEAKVGTKITLTQLKKKRTAHSAAALRKRIARRFSIIGRTSVNGDKFSVSINGSPIGPQDRDDLQAVEFLWEFGASSIPDTHLPALKKRFKLDPNVDFQKPEWLVSGWLGAAARPTNLNSADTGLMNGLIVIARGRLIQENILDKLGYNRILASYLTGQIEANFLDTLGEDDIATSDRQRLMEDDDRYVALAAFLRKTLVSISDEWTRLRNEARGKEAIDEYPALAEWLLRLPPAQRQAAKQTLGVIQGVELEADVDREALYKSGIIAFERLRLQEASHQLGEKPELTAEQLLPLLADLQSLEGSMYRDIVKGRLSIIQKFEDLVDENAKETVLQTHLFENLWLLDSGWERAAGSERIEQTLKKEFKEFSDGLTAEQSNGRLDIRYRTNAGEHIIVELKRYRRSLSVPELQQQGQKYRSALVQCLQTIHPDQQHPLVSIVFVLGTALPEESDPSMGKAYVANTLSALNARVVYYDSLIHGARESYAEYLKASREFSVIEGLLDKLKRKGS